MNENSFDRQLVPLATVCCGSPVLDVQGAFVGRVEYVRTGEPDLSAGRETGQGDVPPPAAMAQELTGDRQVDERLRSMGFVKVHRDGLQDRDLLVSAAQIAYVADDHLRLSVTADDVLLSADHL
jgi:hypothetical protein